MHQYAAQVEWKRGDQIFSDNKYSRGHQWVFDGGLRIPASSSPLSVPLPFSVEANVDPEEALIAALSSCHMLFFLAFACKQGFLVDSYEDKASGIMEKNAAGKMAITHITLKPHVVFSGEKQPDQQTIDALHHLSHEHCYIANSINAEVMIEAM